MRSLSAAEARRVALAAQGLPRRPRVGRPNAKTLHELVRGQGLLQLDSVNVLARAHYVPAFSRLGPYDPTLLDRLAYRDKLLYEGWSHAASLLPAEMWPLHGWRRRAHRADWDRYVNDDFRAYAQRVHDEVAARGPIAAGELSDPGPRRAGSWWNRSTGKQALEYLFGAGEVAVADRRGFERLYDLTERVIPAEFLDAPEAPDADARRALILHAAGALGVATLDDLADYFRLKLTPSRTVVRDLVATGELQVVEVEDWSQAAYAPADVKVPRRVSGHALLNPFDPIVWYRPRSERLFGFHYRIEIYVPAPKRIHGYYVLPFLMGDTFAARVDLKADRASKVLRVFAAWIEPGAPVADTAPALADELGAVAAWLQLDNDIDVHPKGDLAPALAAEIGAG